jgi:hypothetical protein
VDVLSIVLGVTAVFGSGGTVAYWRVTHSDSARNKRKEEIGAQITTAIAPLQSDIHGIRTKLDSDSTHAASVIKAALHDALEPIRDQVSTLNTKIEPLWEALVQGARHNAEVLHHPDPERAELDELLDHFQENTLTFGEELRLRRFLVKIKNWEPGIDLGFPVYESEPSAAANLLSMLDLVRIYRERSRR